jgi:TatD DNase family protein
MNNFINIHTHKNNCPHLNIYNLKYNEKINSKFYSFGLHPWDINNYNTTDFINKLNILCKNNKIAAVGEIGIDRSIDILIEYQKKIFLKQLYIAENYNLPVIIHCVKAYSDFLKILKNKKNSSVWIFHGFNANLQIAEKLINKGCFLSFGRQLLTNRKLQDVFKQIPVDNVFFETDDSSEKIEKIYKKAAYIQQINIDDLKTRIFSNFEKIFNQNLKKNNAK